jgi:hypothetical protein
METAALIPRILTGARIDGVPSRQGDLFLTITVGDGRFYLVKASGTAQITLRSLTMVGGEIATPALGIQYGFIRARGGSGKSLLARVVEFNHMPTPAKVVAIHRLSDGTMTTTLINQQTYEVSVKSVVAETPECMKLGLAAAKAGISGVRVKMTHRV